MKRLSFFILALAILFLAVPAVQAADYTLLKNDYISAHPGQAIIPYPWEPITSIKVLPFNYEIPAAPGNTLAVTACRNEYEPASFILSAQKDLSGITITVPDLHDVKGNTIPSSATDVRLVKVWYQAAASDIEYSTAGKYLTPELLLKDDSLVNVNYGTKVNYLKVSINGVEQYIDISSPTAALPSNAQVHDAVSLLPFALKAQENKQIWVTVHVPATTPAGDYTGNILITAPSETPVTMTFRVTVLPFELEPAPLEYGLYYTGKVSNYPAIGSELKTRAQYQTELQDMKDHGVAYPTLYQWYAANPIDTVLLNDALSLRDAVGFPKDKIYLVETSTEYSSYIGNAQDPAGLAAIAKVVTNWRDYTEAHGYTDTYFYAMDEVRNDILSSQRPAWQTVHENGGKMFVAGSGSELLKVADILDTGIVCEAPNAAQADIWHDYGHTVLSYGDPQVGVENPEVYRKNFGFVLWNAGYDGAMDFAYQYQFGQSIWNDFDDATSPRYRDHVFTYPVTDGVIDTIQWEGWREGVDDTRYVAALIKKEGSDASAKTIVTNSLSQGNTMTTIRKNIVNKILLSPIPTPTPTPTTPSAVLTAKVISTTIPALMKTNTSYSVSLTMKNTGNIPWNEASLIRLGGVGDSAGDAAKFGPVRIMIPTGTSVVPGAQYTFTFTMSPPATPGSYSPKYQMVWERHQWYGDQASQYVRVTSTPTPAPSPAPTQITKSSITVTKPNGGESWVLGTTPTISWTSSGSVGSSVKIELMKAGVVSQTISTSTPNDGTFTSWTIPSTLTTGTDYRIRITSTSNTAITDTSNNYFTITAATTPSPAAITVATPDGGEKWARGNSPTIKWTSSGSMGSSVKIELMKAGGISQTISTTTPNDGTFTSWTIPSTLTTGTDYRIRITSTSNTAITDTSNNYFTITAATTPSPAAITVATPDGGEKWARGNSPTIKWTSSGSVGSSVKIELMKAGEVSQTISTTTPNDGTFTSWTIPSTLATGTDYRIRITSTSNTAIADTSNNYFTITAATTPSPAGITVSGFG